jgi:hypothetical protein
VPGAKRTMNYPLSLHSAAIYLVNNHKGVTKPSNTTIDVIKLFNDYNCVGPL